MSTFARSLAASLPKPKYTGEDETLPGHTRSRGPRILSADAAEAEGLVTSSNTQTDLTSVNSQMQLTAPGSTPNSSAKPATKGNALVVQRDATGKIDYNVIARQGHSESRIIHASFKDLIPLRQRADAGDLSLARPSEEEVEEAKTKTSTALAKLVSGAVAAQRPKLVQGTNRPQPTYVRYTPANQMGDTPKQERLIKIVSKQIDPMAPPKFKHKKIPRAEGSPPPPLMRSPPRKLTAADQAAWRIPPPVSNWKNPKGYTVPLDKRLAADGRGLQDVTISEKFAHFHEALYMADRHAREEVRQRAQMQQKLAEKEKLEKEESLRRLAQKAREDRQKDQPRGRRMRSRSADTGRSSSRSVSASDSSSDFDTDDERDRTTARRERRRENQRELRRQRMGAERRARVMAQESGRDISERVALGLAKPSKPETMYDSRLFDRDSGFNSGFNEDQPYDKPLFAAQEAVRSIYRPSINEDEDEDGDATMDGIQKSGRFEVLGRAKAGFSGAEGQARDGPVQFQKDDDPFNIGQMIEDVQREQDR